MAVPQQHGKPAMAIVAYQFTLSRSYVIDRKYEKKEEY